MSKNYYEIPLHGTVLCDYCNGDYTESDEQGGVQIGSYAICPRCAKEAIQSAEQYQEEYTKCPEGMTFRDWVLQLRNGNDSIRIFGIE